MGYILTKVLLSLAMCFMLISGAYAENVEDVKQNIIRQATAMGIEPAIALSIAKTESGFRQSARGAGGHIGVYQLSSSTARHLGVNPYDLNDNIKGGLIYYKNMYNKFGSMELALAAYNSGPEAVKRCNNTIPGNSRPFVSRIMNDYRNYKNSGL